MLCGGTLIWGCVDRRYIPRIVLGRDAALFIGLTFMVEWLIDAIRLLPLADYVLVWVILAVIASVGFGGHRRRYF